MRGGLTKRQFIFRIGALLVSVGVIKRNVFAGPGQSTAAPADHNARAVVSVRDVKVNIAKLLLNLDQENIKRDSIEAEIIDEIWAEMRPIFERRYLVVE